MYIQTKAENCVDTYSDSFRILKESGKNQNIIFNSLCKKCYFPKHTDSLSLKFSFQGKEHYQYGNNTVGVNSSNFLILNEGQEHSSWIESETWVQSFAIYLNSSFANGVIQDLIIEEDKLIDTIGMVNSKKQLDFFQTLLPFNHDFYRRVENFKRMLEYTQGSDEFWIDENLRLLLSECMKHYCNQILNKVNEIEAVKLSTKVEILKRINIAKDFIESYYTDDISLKDISNVSFLSENMLLRHFKKIFNTTPYQYITQRRLQFAKELLCSSDIPINKITLATGFQSPSSFGRVFKTAYGITPEGYRNRITI